MSRCWSQSTTSAGRCRCRPRMRAAGTAARFELEPGDHVAVADPLRRDRHAGVVGVDQERGDAVGGLRRYDEQLGDRAGGDHRLDPGEQPVLAVEVGLRRRVRRDVLALLGHGGGEDRLPGARALEPHGLGGGVAELGDRHRGRQVRRPAAPARRAGPPRPARCTARAAPGRSRRWLSGRHRPSSPASPSRAHRSASNRPSSATAALSRSGVHSFLNTIAARAAASVWVSVKEKSMSVPWWVAASRQARRPGLSASRRAGRGRRTR